MSKVVRIPNALREDVLRRSRTHYVNDPQKDGFCPRCTNKITDRRHNFCGFCGAGLVSTAKIEEGLLNSDVSLFCGISDPRLLEMLAT